jgi:hypothetical protein
MRNPHRLAQLLRARVVRLVVWIQTGRGRDTHEDRGSDTVAAIILTAGFAALAFVIYLAVKGKIPGWIAKIPGGDGAP